MPVYQKSNLFVQFVAIAIFATLKLHGPIHEPSAVLALIPFLLILYSVLATIIAIIYHPPTWIVTTISMPILVTLGLTVPAISQS